MQRKLKFHSFSHTFFSFRPSAHRVHTTWIDKNVARNASTQCAGYHGYSYARETDLWLNGVEGRGRPCLFMSCRLRVRSALLLLRYTSLSVCFTYEPQSPLLLLPSHFNNPINKWFWTILYSCFRQSEVIETNCTSMTQFWFYCDKLYCIRSDIGQTGWSLSQWSIHCFKCSMNVSNK